MNLRQGVGIIFLFLMTAAFAEEEPNVAAHHKWEGEALKVIEEKCLVCHNRQRIEAAVKERKEMEKIQEAMEEKGAALSQEDREVLGHFWGQNPLRDQKQSPKQKEWH